MSALRPLRGACQCGRNRYIIAIPEESASDAEVHFNTEPEHRMLLRPLLSPSIYALEAHLSDTLTSRGPARNTARSIYPSSLVLVSQHDLRSVSRRDTRPDPPRLHTP